MQIFLPAGIFLKVRALSNLNVLDIFNTRWSKYISRGPNFYTRGESLPRRRQLNLTINYRIKQSKPAQPVKSAE